MTSLRCLDIGRISGTRIGHKVPTPPIGGHHTNIKKRTCDCFVAEKSLHRSDLDPICFSGS